MTSLLHAALALAMTTPGTPSFHTASQSLSEPVSQQLGTRYNAHLTIDTSALRDELDPTEVDKQQALFEREIPTLFLGEVDLVDSPSDDAADVRIVVRWKDFADFRYGVTIEATTPGGTKNETTFDFQGDEHDLVKRLEEEVPTVVGWLEVPEQASGPPDAPPEENPPPPEPPRPPDDPRLHAMGKAGIGVAAVGLAAGITGAILFTLKDTTTTLDGGQRESTEERRFPTPSIALMAVGGAALITGVALIATDLSRSKKTKSRAALAPVLSTHGGGLSLSGRF